jgi:hypothetical protein
MYGDDDDDDEEPQKEDSHDDVAQSMQRLYAYSIYSTYRGKPA